MHEYCLTTDIEVLSLANIVENSKLEKDDFHFLTKNTELAMYICATFHVCRDNFMFIGKIREAPNIRVKEVSGTSQAAGIGVTKLNIKDKEDKVTARTLASYISRIHPKT